jgi:hypothetical protein
MGAGLLLKPSSARARSVPMRRSTSRTAASFITNSGALDMTSTKSASLVEGANIPCEDLISFQSRCIRNDAGQHHMQARLILTESRHSGTQVTIAIDGKPFTVAINGIRAELFFSPSHRIA